MNQPLRISPWLEQVSDMRRYPALSGAREADVVVIGGGIVGVLAAWHLAQSGKKVALIEKNHLATGDTGLTTGFLTRLPDSLLFEIENKYGAALLQKVFTATERAQQELIRLIHKNSIDCDFVGCDSYYGAYEKDDATLHRTVETLKKIDAGDQLVQNDSLTPFANALRFSAEGKFNVRKFIFGLLGKKTDAPLQIFEESEALDVTVGQVVVVKTRQASVTCDALIVSMGDPKGLFPELSGIVKPRLTYVIAARFEHAPISQDLFWDTEDPYFYYRMIDEHTLVIGGCDVPVEKAGSKEAHEKLKQFLIKRFGTSFTVTHQWSGSLFETADGLPSIGEHPHYKNKVFVAMGFGGNGLVCGALAARVLSALATGTNSEEIEMFSFSRTGITIPKPVSRVTLQTPHVKKFIPFATLDEFQGKKVVSKVVTGIQLAVFKTGSGFSALRNVCTHAGGSLADGTIEGTVVECPLHGARFDMTTGVVVAPPASRPTEKFNTRVVGDSIEVELPQASEEKGMSPSRTPLPKPNHWAGMLKFAVGAIVFWLAEFAYQYYVLIPGELGGSLVRSFGLAGATLIGGALLSSAVFKWFPRMARYWRFRRHLGVSGFIFIFFHVGSVMQFLFDYDLRAVYYSLNPIENPIIFGSIAFPILFVMAVTSTDWMVQKLKPKRWKFIHRFVYIAYVSAIFHFITINPSLLKNPAGYLLLLVTVAAVVGQLFWFFKTAVKRKFRSLGTYVGLGIILATVVVGHLIYSTKFSRPSTGISESQQEEEPLETSVQKMKEFMQGFPGKDAAPSSPAPEDQSFGGLLMKTGEFRNLNYMTSGKARLEQERTNFFVVFDETFATPEGPDLVVYLTKNSDPTNRSDIRQGIALGPLKSLNGKQVYPVPSGVNIGEYHSVSIHCRAFNVPWSYVPFN